MRSSKRILHEAMPALVLAGVALLCQGGEEPSVAPKTAEGKGEPSIEFRLPPSTNRINLLDPHHPPLQPKETSETKTNIGSEKAEALAKQIEEHAGGDILKTSSHSAVDSVNKHAGALPESDNILTEKKATPAQQIKNYEQKLEQAHVCRENQDYETAESCLVYVLQGAAPDEMKSSALLEYAGMCAERKQYPRAQQLYAQWIRKFPEHPNAPEVLLRQGLIYRDMGAPEMALTKFSSVLSSALVGKSEWMEYYKKIVLRAQTEIADTFYLQGKYGFAIDKYQILLKPSNPDAAHLNREAILYKMIRALYALQRYPEAVAQSEIYIHDFPDAVDQAEVRFTMASALKKMGRDEESIQQTMLLLQSQRNGTPERWRYWQQRTGNSIANELYQQGDYLNALLVYKKLADLDTSTSWQLPVFYQLGLVYEQLKQPEKALDCYKSIISREKEINTTPVNPNLATVLDMARFRTNSISWQLKAERVEREFSPAVPEAKPSSTTSHDPA